MLHQKYYEITDQQTVYQISEPKQIQQSLNNVVGIDECKKQIEQVIKFIKEKDTFIQKGAKLPKGILLYGEPGVGKTLLARAIAKESNVNFIYQNGSTFDQIYVGSGSRRVRQLFQKAREMQPCIIFVDEIDSLLSKTRRFNETSSSRSTVNGFLSQLDGFKERDNIILLGATNHLDIIDQAAQRAGRMDMKIYVPKPDEKGRTAMFQLYLKKIQKNLVKVSPKFLAQISPGFTGAQIKNLVNTAICDRTHKELRADPLPELEILHPYTLQDQDLIEARDKILMGIERKNLSMTQVHRLNTAIHETGHTITALLTKGANSVEKVTIVPRSQALGVTLMVPQESQERSVNKESLLAMVDVAMGGHIAEKLFIGNQQITSGCSNDLAKATEYAKMAVRQYGMFSDQGIGFLSSSQEDVSQDFNSNIDDCVRKILDQSAERVHCLLLKNKKKVMEISKQLYLNDQLSKDEIDEIVKEQNFWRSKQKSSKKQHREWTNQLDKKFFSTQKRLKNNDMLQNNMNEQPQKIEQKQEVKKYINIKDEEQKRQVKETNKREEKQQIKESEQKIETKSQAIQERSQEFSRKDLFSAAKNDKKA